MEDKNNSEKTAAVENATAGPSPAKKSVKSKTKSQRSKSSHPPTSEMVNAAIKGLKDRKGSSLQAIKKYIASTYKVDGEKMAPFIKKYLKAAITSGVVVQTKGKGASGSFKLATSKGSEPKSKPKRSVKKTESVAAEKKPAEKKPASPKKPATPKKAAAVKKPPTPAKKPSPKKAKTAAAKKAESAKQKAAPAKTLSKTKKVTKAPAAKTKTPKPKTAKSSKAARAAAKK
ncbi:histone H1-like [Osmia bicornis bicornis]|uniref:histone H1-like n=1 Tax=Osmia bicornis bicornis TaxID=1437191 RepID=UPI0010F47E40|nr:histone H1-like [Osmia bicornis bicornis]